MKPRLSGTKYIRQYSGEETKVGNWYTRKGDDTYLYCLDLNCKSKEEHEYAFDGQIFYKKKES